jgi:hypothetical protein
VVEGIRVFNNECVVIEKKGGMHGWVKGTLCRQLRYRYDDPSQQIDARIPLLRDGKTQPASCGSC